MLEGSAWWDASWNPMTGCLPEYPCWDRCWARRMAVRLAANPTVRDRERYEGFLPQLWPERFEQPGRMRKPKMIFLCDMGDLFASNRFAVDKVMKIVGECQQHTFMLLTKRIEQAYMYFREQKAPRNLWLGVSASTQVEVNSRVSTLLKVDVTKRFVSLEPLLEEVTLTYVQWKGIGRNALRVKDDGEDLGPPEKHLDWVIVGGETGAGARPMHPQWVRKIRNECVDENVPFWFKHWGTSTEKLYPEALEIDGQEVYFRLVDGRTWNQRP